MTCAGQRSDERLAREIVYRQLGVPVRHYGAATCRVGVAEKVGVADRRLASHKEGSVVVSLLEVPEARQLSPGEARARFADELCGTLGEGWTAERFRRALGSGELSLRDERVLRLHLLLPLAG